MKADILFSGSRGNAILIRTADTSVLIDCGKSARAVCSALTEAGSSIDKIDAIFITHEHSDHTSALDVLCSKRDIPVHVTKKSFPKLGKHKNASRCIICHEETYEEKVGDLSLRSFPVPHDSDGNVGYVIEDSHGDTLGIVTDMGHVTKCVEENLSGCRRAIIESNHDEDMLKSGPYPFDLKLRILSPKGHLSNSDCSLLACILAQHGCESIALAHISKDNNTYDIAYSETRRALDSSGHPDCDLVVTYMDEPVTLPEGRRTEYTEEPMFADM